MRIQQIIAIIVVIVLAGAGGAGYQFYVKPKWEKFAADQKFLRDLETKAKSLKDKFPNGKPQATVEAVTAQIQPWAEAVEDRARQFTVRDFKKVDEVPSTAVLRAYYATTAKKKVDDIQVELWTKQIYLNPAIDLYFGMPRADALVGKSVHQLEVIYWLQNIQFGTSILRFLADSDVLGIDDLYIWAPKTTTDGFTNNAVGVSMWMTMEGFCKFLEKTQNEDDMCISVLGFSIKNSALRAYDNPPLKIDLVFRIDEYKYEPKPVAMPGATAGAAGAGAGPEAGAPPAEATPDPSLISAERLAQMRAMRQNANASGSKRETKRSEMTFWQKIWPF